MANFSGTSAHTIDAKCRLFLPEPRRKALGDGFVLALSLDCRTLAIYPQDTWAKRVEIVSSNDNDWDFTAHEFCRTFLGMSFDDVVPDSQGRILIPLVARKQFGLSEGSNVLLVGAGSALEIWNEERFANRFEVEPDKHLVAMMEYMRRLHYNKQGIKVNE